MSETCKETIKKEKTRKNTIIKNSNTYSAGTSKNNKEHNL